MDDKEKIVLTDDQGNEVMAEVLFVADYEDKQFIYLIINGIDEQDKVLAFEYRQKDGEEFSEIIPIPEEDTKTWELVNTIFDSFVENGME